MPFTRVPLVADEWGLQETLCYVCDPENPEGLRVPYFLDQLNGHIYAVFEPGNNHTGAPGVTHGGIAMSLLDDGLAWSVVTNAHGLGLTKSATFEFKRPLLVGGVYEVECWVNGDPAKKEIIGEGEIREKNGKEPGRVCVRVVSEFRVLPR